jgi:carboxymethylenebutenolidase
MPTRTLHIPTADGQADAFAAVPDAAGRHPGSADVSGRAELTAQVHFGHAEGDLTPEALEKLNGNLHAAGVSYTSEIYPGTTHGFTMSDTDAFHPAGLQRHWDRLLSLLGNTLTTG